MTPDVARFRAWYAYCSRVARFPNVQIPVLVTAVGGTAMAGWKSLAVRSVDESELV
jgi:hypothetical protein